MHPVKVHIQNRSPRSVTIADTAISRARVRLEVTSLDPARSPDPVATLAAKQTKLPKTLKPKKALVVGFEVPLACVVDPAQSTGDRHSATRCLRSAPWSAARGMLASNDTKRPRCRIASASR